MSELETIMSTAKLVSNVMPVSFVWIDVLLNSFIEVSKKTLKSTSATNLIGFRNPKMIFKVHFHSCSHPQHNQEPPTPADPTFEYHILAKLLPETINTPDELYIFMHIVDLDNAIKANH